MSEQSASSHAGNLVTGLLGVSFVVLKLCGVIDWSWWWVLAPFWVGPAIVVALVAAFALYVAICGKRV